MHAMSSTQLMEWTAYLKVEADDERDRMLAAKAQAKLTARRR